MCWRIVGWTFAGEMIAPSKMIAEMKIAGLIVPLSSLKTVVGWKKRNASLSFAGSHFVGSRTTPAAQRKMKTAQQRFAGQLSKTAGSKFDNGCLKLTSAPPPSSAGLSAAAEQLGRGGRRSAPQWLDQHRSAGPRELLVLERGLLLLLHLHSLHLRLRSGCDRPLSAQAGSCLHFESACWGLSGCRSLS